MRISSKVVIIFVLFVLPMVGCNEMVMQQWQQQWGWPTADTSEMYCARGLKLMDEGNIEAALAELARAIEADSQNAVALTAIGDIHRKEKNYKLARKNYEAACRADQYAFKAHYNLGVTYQALARLAENIDEMQQHITSAVNVYLRAIAIKPDDFNTHLNLGACYFQIAQPGLAEQQTRQALTLKPNSKRANNNIATIYESQGRYDEAIQAYKNSLEADSEQLNIMMKLARVYIKTGHIRAGLWTYRAVSRKAPKSSAPWQQIGLCYFRMKKLDDSLRAFQQAIRVNLDDYEAYRGFGVVCMYQYVKQRDRKDLRNKAIAAWEYSLKIKPNQPKLAKLLKQYSSGGNSHKHAIKTSVGNRDQLSRR